MSTERLIESSDAKSEALPKSRSFRQCGEPCWIFEELPNATIVSVSRPDTGDISPILLSYTIQLHYKQACSPCISMLMFCLPVHQFFVFLVLYSLADQMIHGWGFFF